MELVQGTVSSIEVILTNGTGSLVTGVVKSNVDPYFIKSGGSATQLASANFDWAEHSSTHMPGHYRLTINATGVSANVLDTLGSFVVHIKASAVSPAFVAYPFIGNVVPLLSYDSLRKTRALSLANYRLFPLTWDSVTKEITSGTVRTYPTSTDATNNTNHLEELTITASYNASGEIQTYKVTA